MNDIKDSFFSGSTFLSETKDIGTLVSMILQAALAIAGVIMLFMLLAGGIGMIAGAGKDDPEQAAKGRKAATSAVIGFIIIFAAYWIVRIIELITGISILG